MTVVPLRVSLDNEDQIDSSDDEYLPPQKGALLYVDYDPNDPDEQIANDLDDEIGLTDDEDNKPISSMRLDADRKPQGASMRQRARVAKRTNSSSLPDPLTAKKRIKSSGGGQSSGQVNNVATAATRGAPAASRGCLANRSMVCEATGESKQVSPNLTEKAITTVVEQQTQQRAPKLQESETSAERRNQRHLQLQRQLKGRNKRRPDGERTAHLIDAERARVNSRVMKETANSKAPALNNWVMCDNCEQWRRVAQQPTMDKWYCSDNLETEYRSCSVPQESAALSAGANRILLQQRGILTSLRHRSVVERTDSDKTPLFAGERVSEAQKEAAISRLAAAARSEGQQNNRKNAAPEQTRVGARRVVPMLLKVCGGLAWWGEG